MERIRTALEENPAHGYSPASPWPAVSASGIREVEIGGTKSPLLPLCCWPEPSNQPEAWTIRIRIDSSVHLDKGQDWTAHLARAAKGQRQHAREEGVQPNRLDSTIVLLRLTSSPRAIVSTSGGGEAAKEGWPITFEHIACNLDLQLVASSGLWKLTSRTGRATGAMDVGGVTLANFCARSAIPTLNAGTGNLSPNTFDSGTAGVRRVAEANHREC